MKTMKSERGIDFVSDFDVVEDFPFCTVERHNKWYSIYLVRANEDIIKLDKAVYGKDKRLAKGFRDDYDDVERTAHSWCPKDLVWLCFKHNMYIGEQAYKAIVHMWAEECVGSPENVVSDLPTKDLYDMVVVPDGDFDVRNVCTTLSDEEYDRFKYYVN